MRSTWLERVLGIVFSVAGFVLGAGLLHAEVKEATGQIALIDTTLGRLRCTLFSKEAPTAVAAFIGFAEGSRECGIRQRMLLQPASRLYDGTRLYGIPAGLRGGIRYGPHFNQEAPAYFIPEPERTLRFDRPGRLLCGE